MDSPRCISNLHHFNYVEAISYSILTSESFRHSVRYTYGYENLFEKLVKDLIKSALAVVIAIMNTITKNFP